MKPSSVIARLENVSKEYEVSEKTITRFRKDTWKIIVSD